MKRYENKKIEYGYLVGYMLKIKKNGYNTRNEQDIFNAIKHSNFKSFLNCIGVIDDVVVYDNNKIEKLEINNMNNHIIFAKLLSSKTAIKKYIKKLEKRYGSIIDHDISDETYYDLALFELRLRNSLSNKDRKKEQESTLENVIDELSLIKNMANEDKNKLHLGRKYLNAIKHNKNNIDIEYFYEALNICEKYKLKLDL